MRFFISSTYIDLVEYRAYTIEYLKNLTDNKTGDFAAMEYFVASEDTSKEVCLCELEKSDIVIGIYGSRFGWVEEETGRSMTEIEFDRAMELGKPVLGFVTYNEQEERQKRFISEKVFAQGRNCGRFRTLEDYANVLHDSIKKYFDETEGFSYSSIWSDIKLMRQIIDEDINAGSLHMQIYEDGSEGKALARIRESILYLQGFIPLIHKMYNNLADGIKDYHQDDNISVELRNKWEHLFLGFPNAVQGIRLGVSFLNLSYLQHRLLTETWTEDLRKEVIKARDEYLEISENSYHHD